MRIYTSTNDPLDFCVRCFPKTEEAAWELYAGLGDGPDGRGNCFAYDADHPAYDCDEYRCCECKKILGNEDEIQIDYHDSVGKRIDTTRWKP